MESSVGIVDVVIMAAGKGTRMKSRLPKVLHPLAGRALVHHVLATAAELGARNAVLITAAGRSLLEQASAKAREHEARMAGFLSSEEKASLMANLRRIYKENG